MIFNLLKYYFSTIYWDKASVDAVKRMQLKKFREIFEYARINSKFYKNLYDDAGVLELKIESISDIEKIPVIDKYLLKKYDYQDILTRPITNKLNLHPTSGSTGEPFKIYQNKFEDYTAHVRVFIMLQTLGYNPFRNITMITRYESDDKFKVEGDIRILSKLQKYLNLFQRHIISIYEEPAVIIKKVVQNKPFILWSTPSVLDMVANELLMQNKRLDIPYVVLTSENIAPHQYKKFFSCISKNVIGLYGLMEAPSLAYDINNTGRLLTFPNTFFVEYLNQQMHDGQSTGTPVVTNLVNFTMPFIRYNTHDVSNMLDTPGFPFKEIGYVRGRIDDILQFPDANLFVHHHAHEMFMDFEECEQFKFYQVNNGPIVLQLKPNKSFSKELIKIKAMQRWNKRFSKYPLKVEFVENFEINQITGKFKNIEKILEC